jgi:DNA invertase Pin-like site-specific DNA recombinase
MNVITELKPLCYSYVRLSTPDQIKGDSKRRQVDKARKWALDNGYEFDDPR